MHRFALGTVLFICLGLGPAAAQDEHHEPPPQGKKLIEIYRIAPGQHEAFLRAIARCDEVNRRAGLPARQLYIHADGASWDFLLIQDAEYPEGAGEAVAKAWDELRLPSGPRFFTEFRRFVLEHTDTFAHGPTSAAAYLAQLDATPPSPGFDSTGTPVYQLQSTVALAGIPRWDQPQVDAAARKLYLAHDNVVEVLDLDSHRVLGQVRGLAGARGIALAPELDRGLVANGDRDTVSTFSLSSLEVMGEAAVGSRPDSVTYEPVSQRIAVWSRGGRELSVLEAASLATVATLPLGATPKLAVADGRGLVLANLEESHQIVRVDMADPGVVGHFELDGCVAPHGLAIDPESRHLFSACANELLLVLDADSGDTLGRARIGRGTEAVVFDPLRARVYASSSEGFVTVVDVGGNGAPLRSTDIQTRATGRTMAVDPLHGTLFVPAARLDLDWGERQAAFAADGLKVLVYQPIAP